MIQVFDEMIKELSYIAGTLNLFLGVIIGYWIGRGRGGMDSAKREVKAYFDGLKDAYRDRKGKEKEKDELVKPEFEN